jgi:hypothetical protein
MATGLKIPLKTSTSPILIIQVWHSRLKICRPGPKLIGHAQLRSFVDDDGHFWLEQNAAKKTKWAKLARDGHHVAWEFSERGGSYTGRLLIDGEIYTPSEATKKFLDSSTPSRSSS